MTQSTPDQTARAKYLAAQKALQAAAYDLLVAWDDEDVAEALRNDAAFMDKVVTVFPLSFDEWWHELADLTERVEAALQPPLSVDALRGARIVNTGGGVMAALLTRADGATVSVFVNPEGAGYIVTAHRDDRSFWACSDECAEIAAVKADDLPAAIAAVAVCDEVAS